MKLVVSIKLHLPDLLSFGTKWTVLILTLLKVVIKKVLIIISWCVFLDSVYWHHKVKCHRLSVESKATRWNFATPAHIWLQYAYGPAFCITYEDISVQSITLAKSLSFLADALGLVSMKRPKFTFTEISTPRRWRRSVYSKESSGQSERASFGV